MQNKEGFGEKKQKLLFLYYYNSPQIPPLCHPAKNALPLLYEKTEPNSRFCAGPGANLERNCVLFKAANRTPQKFSFFFHILLTIREREFCGATEKCVPINMI
jgi:hypothetical protein